MYVLKKFVDVFLENTDRKLAFQYKEGELLKGKYHITEVKNNHIQSVDCGGRVHEWFETVFQ